jgi:hypothetical protein
MRKVITVLLLVFLSACGGGGGGGSDELELGLNDFENCDFNFVGLMNGSSSLDYNQFFDCDSGDDSFTFSLFPDGSGLIAYNGGNDEAMTWTQTGCDKMAYTSSIGKGTASNIMISVDSGIISFENKLNGEAQLPATCQLYEF